MREWIKAHSKVVGPIGAFAIVALISLIFCLLVLRPASWRLQLLQTTAVGIPEQVAVLEPGDTYTQNLSFTGAFKEIALDLLVDEPLPSGSISLILVDSAGTTLATVTNLHTLEPLLTLDDDPQTAEPTYQWVAFPFDSEIETADGNYTLTVVLLPSSHASTGTADTSPSPTNLVLYGSPERSSPVSTTEKVADNPLNVHFIGYASFLVPYFLIIALALSLLAALLWHLMFTRKTHLANIFLVAALVIGLTQMFVSTPYGSNLYDESGFADTTRYHAAVLLGNEHVVTDGVNASYERRAIDDFAGFNGFPQITSYYHIWTDFLSPEPAGTPLVTASNTYYYGQAYRFVLPILGTVLGNLLHLGQIATLFLAKAGNLLLYLVLGFLTIRRAPQRFQLLFTLLCLMPLPIYYATTMSYDVPINVLSFFFIACTLRLREDGGTIGLKQALPLFISGALLAPMKLVYFPLLLLPLIIPARKFRAHRGKTVFMLALLTVGLAAIALSNWETISWLFGALFGADVASARVAAVSRGAWYYSPDDYYSYSFVFSQKTEFLRIYSASLLVGLEKFLQAPIYIPSAPIPNFAGFVALLLLVFAVPRTEKPSKGQGEKSLSFTGRQLALFGAIILTVYLAVSFAAIPWTEPGSYALGGVHGRYFAPLLPLLAVLGAEIIGYASKNQKTPSLQRGLLIGVFVLNLYALFTVFSYAIFTS
jgi:hypothetical protein